MAGGRAKGKTMLILNFQDFATVKFSVASFAKKLHQTLGIGLNFMHVGKYILWSGYTLMLPREKKFHVLLGDIMYGTWFL